MASRAAPGSTTLALLVSQSQLSRPDPAAIRLCAQLFHAQVSRTPQCTGSVADAGRNGHGLPCPQLDLPTVLQINRETSAGDDEQLVGTRMVVPSVGFFEDSKSQAMIVEATDDHVSVGFRHGRAFAGQIDDLQSGVTHRFAGVGLRC
jgi:hypothetical protein